MDVLPRTLRRRADSSTTGKASDDEIAGCAVSPPLRQEYDASGAPPSCFAVSQASATALSSDLPSLVGHTTERYESQCCDPDERV